MTYLYSLDPQLFSQLPTCVANLVWVVVVVVVETFFCCVWMTAAVHRIPERQLSDQEGCVNLPLPFAFVSFWCQTKMQFVAAFMIDFIFVLVYLWIDLLNNINRCSSIDDEITACNLHSFFQICNTQNLLHAAVLWGTAVFWISNMLPHFQPAPFVLIQCANNTACYSALRVWDY